MLARAKTTCVMQRAACCDCVHACSPLAWARKAGGGLEPFDRHDWVVDRCGREVRYIIDFYFHEQKAGTPEVRGCCWGRVGVGVDMGVSVMHQGGVCAPPYDDRCGVLVLMCGHVW